MKKTNELKKLMKLKKVVIAELLIEFKGIVKEYEGIIKGLSKKPSS